MTKEYIDRLVELAEEIHLTSFKTNEHFMAKLNFLLGYIMALKKEGEEK